MPPNSFSRIGTLQLLVPDPGENHWRWSTARNLKDKRINTQIATLNQVAASGSSKIKKPKNKQETTTDPKKKRDQRYDALKEGRTKQQFI